MKKFNVKKVFIPVMSILVAATPILVSTQVSKNTTSLIDVAKNNFNQINLMSELVSEETGLIKKLDENSIRDLYIKNNNLDISLKSSTIDKDEDKKKAEMFNYLTDPKTTDQDRENFAKKHFSKEKFEEYKKEIDKAKDTINKESKFTGETTSRRVGIAIDEHGNTLFENTPNI